MSQNPRSFENPYPDFQPGSPTIGNGVNINMESVRGLALEKAEEVLVKGTKSGDGGVYVGAVGCTYMILHIFDKLSDEEKRRLLPLAVNAYQVQAMHFAQNPGNRYQLNLYT